MRIDRLLTLLAGLWVGLLGGLTSTAMAQGIVKPAPTPPPAPANTPQPPGLVRPMPPFYPGGLLGGIGSGIGGGFGYGYLPFYPFYSWYPPLYSIPAIPVSPPAAPPPLTGAGGGTAAFVPHVAAQVTIEFPTKPEIVAKGGTLSGEGSTRIVTTKPIRSGDTTTVELVAHWTIAEQRYEWKQTVTLGCGQHTRLVVLRGDPVSK